MKRRLLFCAVWWGLASLLVGSVAMAESAACPTSSVLPARMEVPANLPEFVVDLRAVPAVTDLSRIFLENADGAMFPTTVRSLGTGRVALVPSRPMEPGQQYTVNSPGCLQNVRTVYRTTAPLVVPTELGTLMVGAHRYSADSIPPYYVEVQFTGTADAAAWVGLGPLEFRLNDAFLLVNWVVQRGIYHVPVNCYNTFPSGPGQGATARVTALMTQPGGGGMRLETSTSFTVDCSSLPPPAMRDASVDSSVDATSDVAIVDAATDAPATAGPVRCSTQLPTHTPASGWLLPLLASVGVLRWRNRRNTREAVHS